MTDKIEKKSKQKKPRLKINRGDPQKAMNFFNQAMTTGEPSMNPTGGMAEAVDTEISKKIERNLPKVKRDKNESVQLNEVGLSRIIDHIKDKKSFAIIGSQDKDTKENRYNELLQLVRKIPYRVGWNNLEGTYTYDSGEVGSEDSLIIYNIKKEDALNIAKKINQESIIWKDENFFGFLTAEGEEDGNFGGNLSFDKDAVKAFGSKLKGKHNNAKGFVFESSLVETTNRGSNFSRQHRAEVVKYPVLTLREEDGGWRDIFKILWDNVSKLNEDEIKKIMGGIVNNIEVGNPYFVTPSGDIINVSEAIAPYGTHPTHIFFAICLAEEWAKTYGDFTQEELEEIQDDGWAMHIKATSYLDHLRDGGWIRFNTGTAGVDERFYAVFPGWRDVKPTKYQWMAFEDFLDCGLRAGKKEVLVFFKGYQGRTFNLDNIDDVLARCKRYFSSGTIYEQKEKRKGEGLVEEAKERNYDSFWIDIPYKNLEVEYYAGFDYWDTGAYSNTTYLDTEYTLDWDEFFEEVYYLYGEDDLGGLVEIAHKCGWDDVDMDNDEAIDEFLDSDAFREYVYDHADEILDANLRRFQDRFEEDAQEATAQMIVDDRIN